MAELKDISLFLLDMDGTVNLGFDPIDGAEDFLDEVRKQGKNYIFLTNNSSRNAGDYVEKMRKLGFFCERENVFTSGMAAGLFLKKNKPDARVYVCGTRSLCEEVKSYGVNVTEDNADTVLLGYDTELNYEKIKKVCALLSEGADYYATNVDMVCPIEGGRYLPDCGSFADMFYNAVKRRPVFLGKPDRTMIDIVLEKQTRPMKRRQWSATEFIPTSKQASMRELPRCLCFRGKQRKKTPKKATCARLISLTPFGIFTI